MPELIHELFKYIEARLVEGQTHFVCHSYDSQAIIEHFTEKGRIVESHGWWLHDSVMIIIK